MTETFDVVVVGGGPAGSTAATVVAMRGHRVMLLEKETFPRYQIGESLLPSTVHGICRILGVTDEVGRAGFTVKNGGTFRWGRNPEPWRFSFAMSPRLPEPTSTALQVERAKFDHILLRNAARVGVDVREQCQVRGVIEADGRVQGVEYTDAGGARHTVHARYVVDASGNTSRIHGRVGGSRVYSDFFRNLAVFGYFAGGDRLPQPNAGNIFCAAFDAGWLWYIPLRDNLTSVGAVVSAEHRAAVQGDPRAVWRSMIEACPEISSKLVGVPVATEQPYDQVRVRKDYSYWKQSFSSPGMLLVGDAACFVDPVISSGVHLATYGALLAARSINACLDGAVPEQRSLAEFEARYRREYALFYEFLMSFYDMQSDESSYFWQAKRVTAVDATEAAAFAELVGGLVPGEAGVGLRLTESAADLAGAVGRLATAGDRHNPLAAARTVGETFRQGRNLQEEALYGGPLDDTEPPVPGGLALAKDGLGWIA
ncbi:tryptophan 7-halogenase [Actinoplanes xinjiangensis]|uniref:Halogenation protein CepH n=1 Tax=Actinoplanes xinjiangensis TaxID=512350 RepID=A0A316FFS6_9ACTN|nr:tryptophan 7-halogenase [Actinoplanes xinjiangensis]PWK46912.1 halogenation protein CepH [Actinoplanes xinjiangensis]GIF40070.1 FAD-binding protein [Actinoplanes xinjiangensis]